MWIPYRLSRRRYKICVLEFARLLHALPLPSRSSLPALMAAYPQEKDGEKFRSASLDDAKLESSSVLDENGFIRGSEGVTQHDLDTLRIVPDRLPYTAWLVVIVEFAERYVFIFRLAYHCRLIPA